MNGEVYLIQIFYNGRWIPMYTPCLSVHEAMKKMKLKQDLMTAISLRIVCYRPDHVVIPQQGPNKIWLDVAKEGL